MAAPAAGSGLLLAFQPVFLIPALAMVAALLAGAAIIALFRRWQRDTKFVPNAGEELARYRALYEQGAISEKEYHAVRGVLGVSLKRSMNVVPPHPETIVKDSTEAPPPKPDTSGESMPDTSPGRDMPDTPPDGIKPGS